MRGIYFERYTINHAKKSTKWSIRLVQNWLRCEMPIFTKELSSQQTCDNGWIPSLWPISNHHWICAGAVYTWTASRVLKANLESDNKSLSTSERANHDPVRRDVIKNAPSGDDYVRPRSSHTHLVLSSQSM